MKTQADESELEMELGERSAWVSVREIVSGEEERGGETKERRRIS